MKNIIKFLFVLVVISSSNVHATGFSYNMHQAQKMLEFQRQRADILPQKEVAVSRDLPKEKASLLSADNGSVVVDNEEQHLSGRAVTTFMQWFSGLIMKLLTGTFGR